MKNLVAFIIPAILLIFFVSCEKDLGENEDDPIELYGKWAPVKSELYSYEGDVLTGSSEVEVEWHRIQFNEDGYFIVYLDENDPDNTEVMNWTRSGNLVIIDQDQYNIETLTKDGLVFSTWESVSEKYVHTCTRVN